MIIVWGWLYNSGLQPCWKACSKWLNRRNSYTADLYYSKELKLGASGFRTRLIQYYKTIAISFIAIWFRAACVWSKGKTFREQRVYRINIISPLCYMYIQGLTPQGHFTWVFFKTHHTLIAPGVNLDFNMVWGSFGSESLFMPTACKHRVVRNDKPRRRRHLKP